MASGKSGFCTKCGKKIIGQQFKLGDKVLCASCYAAEMEALQKLESDKASLYAYLKKLFGKDFCPEPVMKSVDLAIRDGKTVAGIRFTVYYYYEILANPRQNMREVQWIIRDYYEEARSYVSDMRKLGEYNKGVNINHEPQKIKIKMPERNKKRYRGRVTVTTEGD